MRIIGLLVEKAIEAIADRFFTTALERDFGDALESDIIIPDTRRIERHPVRAYDVPFARMSTMIDGLLPRHLEKVSIRLCELRIGRTISYAFQVKDAGVPVELQLILTKQADHDVEIDFRSSEAVIGLIESAFGKSC